MYMLKRKKASVGSACHGRIHGGVSSYIGDEGKHKKVSYRIRKKNDHRIWPLKWPSKVLFECAWNGVEEASKILVCSQEKCSVSFATYLCVERRSVFLLVLNRVGRAIFDWVQATS